MNITETKFVYVYEYIVLIMFFFLLTDDQCRGEDWILLFVFCNCPVQGGGGDEGDLEPPEHSPGEVPFWSLVLP